MSFHFSEVRLGTAPPGTELDFRLVGTPGSFTANALLLCGMQTVASWTSAELIGATLRERLVPPGIYALQIDVVFETQEAAEVFADFALELPGAGSQRVRLVGTRPDINRVLAIVVIQ